MLIWSPSTHSRKAEGGLGGIQELKWGEREGAIFLNTYTYSQRRTLSPCLKNQCESILHYNIGFCCDYLYQWTFCSVPGGHIVFSAPHRKLLPSILKWWREVVSPLNWMSMISSFTASLPLYMLQHPPCPKTSLLRSFASHLHAALSISHRKMMIQMNNDKFLYGLEWQLDTVITLYPDKGVVSSHPAVRRLSPLHHYLYWIACDERTLWWKTTHHLFVFPSNKNGVLFSFLPIQISHPLLLPPHIILEIDERKWEVATWSS